MGANRCPSPTSVGVRQVRRYFMRLPAKESGPLRRILRDTPDAESHWVLYLAPRPAVAPLPLTKRILRRSTKSEILVRPSARCFQSCPAASASSSCRASSPPDRRRKADKATTANVPARAILPVTQAQRAASKAAIPVFLTVPIHANALRRSRNPRAAEM